MGGRIHENLSHEIFFTRIIKTMKFIYKEVNTCQKYFKKTKLLDPKSLPLSAVIAPLAIAAANKELKALLNENSNAK